MGSQIMNIYTKRRQWQLCGKDVEAHDYPVYVKKIILERDAR
jgi:hypothetical protein